MKLNLFLLAFLIGVVCVDLYIQNNKVKTFNPMECASENSVIGDDNIVIVVCRSTINEYI